MLQPVLLQNEGGNGGKQRPHEAIESPPVILQDEPSEDDEATQRVVDKHHLGGAAQNPVQQLQQNELPWKREVEVTRAPWALRGKLKPRETVVHFHVVEAERLHTLHPFPKWRHVPSEVGEEFSEAGPGRLRGGAV